MMKETVASLKETVCRLMENSQDIRKEITELKWKSPACPQIHRTIKHGDKSLVGNKEAIDKLRELKKSLKRKNTEKERSRLWYIKKIAGVETRHTLLAYGLLRGIPYPVLERRVRPDHEPNPEVIHQILMENDEDLEDKEKWTVEHIVSLLARNEEVA
jgi:hypothetical protein